MGYQQATQTKNAKVTLQPYPMPIPKSPVPNPRLLHPLLQLQRQIGNQAVSKLIIQAKLEVGKAGDVYEQEADRVADNVIRMPDSLVQRQPQEKQEETARMKPLVGSISPLVQRQSEEEETPQAKPFQRKVEEEEPVQAKPLAGVITPILQRQTEEEEPAQTKLLQRQPEEEERAQTKLVQRQTEEEMLQAKLLQRQADEKETAQANLLQRQTKEEEETAQAKSAAVTEPTVSPDVENSIQAMRGGGKPLPDDTRHFYETRMGYDLSGVRIHTDASAHDAATHLNAQAFTIKQDIFFGAGRYEPQTNSGKWLLAHELTHTVQQQPQPLLASAKVGQAPMATATPSIQGLQRQSVAITAAPSQVQRLFGIELPGIDTVRDWAANRAANIPGFTLLTVILGRNPISDRPVERNATNLIRGALGLIPGGELIFQGLQVSGAIERVGTWLREQIAQLNITWEGIVGLFSQALRSLGARDLLNISGAGERILNIFRPTLDRIRSFASSVGNRVLQFIKEAILRPVGQFAQRLPFYPLLTVILGKDPITDQEVPRNPTNVIRGILLIFPGGEEKFQNLQRSGIIDRAFNWFNQELDRLNLTWNYIKSIFIRLWETLSINDLLSPSAAFERIRGIFGEPVQRITSFAGAAIRKVAEFIFEGVLTLAGGLGQQVLRIFNRARGVFSSIIENPIGFVGNLVNAVKRGFQQFSGNILTHLRTGLIGWLLGALAGSGLQLPERFDLRGIVSLVMQVLGLTYQRLRGILVRLLGSEERVQRAEQVFDFLVTLVRDGIGAAWERIVEFAGNLQEMVIGGIRDWVARTVVGQAIARLVTLFNPAGAIIQAIMAIYNTVVFFIERAQQIGALVEAIFESIANIAGGNIGAAANYVERTMARTIPVILGFLARFIGLGNVGEQIQNIIRRIQAPIETAIERVANWIVTQLRRLGSFVIQAGVPQNPQLRLRTAMQLAVSAVNRFSGQRIGRAILNPILQGIKLRYQMQILELVQMGNHWGVRGLINPEQRDATGALIGESGDEEPLSVELSPQDSPILEVLTPMGIRGHFVPPTNQLNGQKYEQGYVGNVPAGVNPDRSAVAIAELYRDQAFNSPAEAQQRFGLVIGLNLFADLRNQNQATLAAAVRASGAWSHFPLGVFGFLWKPSWKRNGQNITFEEARRLYNSTESQAIKQQMLQDETNLINDYRSTRRFPYGAFRDTIFQHSFTSTLTAQMNERADRVFVHTGDPDAISLRAIQVTPSSQANVQSMGPVFQQVAEGLFNRYDNILRELGDKVVIVSGGYQMSMRANLNTQNIGINELATLLASMLDMEVRRRMSNIDPRTVYFPEPNTLFRITPASPPSSDVYLNASFGRGGSEGRAMINSMAIEKNRETMRMVQVEVITGVAQRFVVRIADKEATVTFDMNLGVLEPDLRAIKAIINNQSQTHASSLGWGQQVGQPYGITRSTGPELSALIAIRNHYFAPVSEVLAANDDDVRRIFTVAGTLRINPRTRQPEATDAEARQVLSNAFASAQRLVERLPALDNHNVFVNHFRQRGNISQDEAVRQAIAFVENANQLGKTAVEGIITFIRQTIIR